MMFRYSNRIHKHKLFNFIALESWFSNELDVTSGRASQRGRFCSVEKIKSGTAETEVIRYSSRRNPGQNFTNSLAVPLLGTAGDSLSANSTQLIFKLI